jgi:hypothetical protein
MKKLLVLAAVAFVATSAHAGEMKWSGGMDWRYDQDKYDDSLGSSSGTAATNSQQKVREQAIRANLDVTGGWDNIEYGVGVRTTNTANNYYTRLGANTDPSIGLDQAWVKYSHDFSVLDLNVTLGRQKNIFAYDATSQILFDNDVRWSGLGWNFKLGSFGLNAGQYVLGSDSGSTSTSTNSNYTNQNISMMYGFQPYMNWRFTDEIDAMLAVAYYSWNNLNSTSNGNLGNGGYQANAGTTGPDTTALAAGTLPIGSLHQWDFTANVNLPYNFALGGEYTLAQNGVYGLTSTSAAAPSNSATDKSLWTAGLVYGKVKKAHDWSLSYYYANKGIASSINAYANELFPADNKGHIIEAKYNIADNFHVGAEALFLKAKSNTNGAGTLYSASAATANQQEKSTYWEVNAGVNF